MSAWRAATMVSDGWGRPRQELVVDHHLYGEVGRLRALRGHLHAATVVSAQGTNRMMKITAIESRLGRLCEIAMSATRNSSRRRDSVRLSEADPPDTPPKCRRHTRSGRHGQPGPGRSRIG